MSVAEPGARLRVQLIYGLEGSPKGAKAKELSRHFELVVPTMDTGDFAASVEVQAGALRERPPDVLVGSSFGGAVAVELIRRELWWGPTVLLAPAPVHFGVEPVLARGVSVIIVHGTRDDVVDPSASRALAKTGDPTRVSLIEVDDDHRLSSLLEHERLANIVRAVARAR